MGLLASWRLCGDYPYPIRILSRQDAYLAKVRLDGSYIDFPWQSLRPFDEFILSVSKGSGVLGAIRILADFYYFCMRPSTKDAVAATGRENP